MMKNYTPKNDLLKNRTILVTGAGAGIGKAVAVAYAKYGAQVILLGRTADKLQAVYHQIQAAGYPAATPVVFDLNSNCYADYVAVATQIENNFYPLYGLVHNAGLLGERKSVGEYSPEVWAEVMQVNVNAQFLLTRALLPLLRKNENGSVIFTSSNAGIQGRANWGAYCVSKFATEGLAQLLADEEKQLSSLRINTINPGRVRTAMRAQAYPDEDPMSLVSPQKVVLTYLYLMDGDNSGITGQRINAQN